MLEDKPFCCEGCKTVFRILEENQLETYYELEQHPGITLEVGKRVDRFAYLDHPDVEQGLIDFKNDKLTHVRFLLPQIHCSSCIWLLENLHKLHPAVISSRVNFLKKEITAENTK